MTTSSEKSAEAFRTISEVAKELGLATHVLRFWESKFPQIKPLKRAGGRRYYRPDDVILLQRLQTLLHDEGYTIKGVQKLLREEGTRRLIDSTPAPQSLKSAPAKTMAGEAKLYQSETTSHQGSGSSTHPQGSLFDTEAQQSTPLQSIPIAHAETPVNYTVLLPDAPEPEPVFEDDYDSADGPPILIQKGLSDAQRTTLKDVLNELIALKEKIDQAA